MTILPALLALALMMPAQTSPELTGGSAKRVQRVRSMEEGDLDALTVRTGAPSPVALTLEGLPAAAGAREAFERGVRASFTARELATERVARRGGAARDGGPLRNRFLLGAEGADPRAWGARLRLQWFVPPDSLRGVADSLSHAWPGLGVRVVIETQEPAPQEAREDAREVPRFAPHPGRSAAVLLLPSGHPVDAAYYQHAGSQVALLLLEALHRADGDLDDDQRLRLDDALRVAPAANR